MKSWIVLGILFALFACSKKEETSKTVPEAKAVAVISEKVALKSFKNYLSLSAETRGKEDVTLTLSSGGIVNSVRDIGIKIKKGDSLCSIESDKFLALFKQAKSAKDLADSELSRIKSHVEKGSLGLAAQTKAELDFWTAEVNLQNAKKTYDESRCISPINGMIAAKYINKFQSLPPGSPTLRLVSIEEIEVVFQIPEKDGQYISQNSPITFYSSTNSNSAKSYPGKIRYIDRAVDSRNRSFQAVALVKNSEGKILPGTVGEVRVLQETQENAVIVPSSALLRQAGGVFVMVIEEGKAKKVLVNLGNSSQGETLVKSGLNAGQEIVVEGAFKLSEGMSVSSTLKSQDLAK